MAQGVSGPKAAATQPSWYSARLPQFSKYCSVLRPGRLRIGEGIGDAHPVDRVLRHAVHDLGRRDAKDLVDRRRDVVHMVELRPRHGVMRDLRGPRDDHRVARAAEIRGDQLGVLERRVPRPGEACVVHVVGPRRPEHVEPAEPLQRLDLLLDRARDVVLRQKLADRAVLALGRGAVVAEDVEDQGVVAQSLAVKFGDDPPGLHVGILDEPGEELHQPRLELALILRNGVPGQDAFGPRVELGVGRYPAKRLLPGKDPFAHRVPAVVELAA